MKRLFSQFDWAEWLWFALLFGLIWLILTYSWVGAVFVAFLLAVNVAAALHTPDPRRHIH